MAEETTVDQTPPQDLPYVDRVYTALKDNLSGFNKTPEEFRIAMKDSGYAAKAYTALKDNLTGFDKSENDFYSQVGLKKKAPTPALPNGVDLSGSGLNPFQNSQQPTDLIPVLPQNRQGVRAQQKVDATNNKKQKIDHLSIVDKESVPFFNKIKELQQNDFVNDFNGDNEEADRLAQLVSKYGNPKIVLNNSNEISHYNPITNTIHLNDVSDGEAGYTKKSRVERLKSLLIEELAHAHQFKDAPLKSVGKWLGNDLVDYVKSGFEHNAPYSDKNSLEHEAHSVIKKKIKNDYDRILKNIPELDPHANAISIAQQQRQTVKPPETPQPQERGVMDKISQALYIPAIKQGFNDLIVSPAAGATDFVDRTIDKAYQGITGEKTPEWLRKKGFFHDVNKQIQEEYDTRDKPKNMVSDVAEGVVGTLPLMASMFTGEGEVSLATKAPQLFGRLAKTLATTKGLTAYKDATENHNGYLQSLGKAAEGAAKGGVEGQFMDAQMLVGGALGKKTADILAERGLLKGDKATKAILNALGVSTVFGGTSAGEDLLQGKDINTNEALKQFGTGLAFELIPTAKGINDELRDRSDAKKINDQAAQAAAVANSASNLNGESALRTLINTPLEQVQQIHKDIPAKYPDLYADSIEKGAQAYEAKDPQEKKDLYTQQLALKAQGDIKMIADKAKSPETLDELRTAINEHDGLSEQEVQDLHAKLDALAPEHEKESVVEEAAPVEVANDQTPTINEQATPNTETTAPIQEQPAEPAVATENSVAPVETATAEEVKPAYIDQTEILPANPLERPDVTPESTRDAIRKSIETETDPKKIAAQYHHETSEPDYIEKGIIDYLGNSKINLSDYERWGDKNNITEGKKLRWLDTKNSDRTGLDQHAEALSHELGVQVTPEDFIETIDRYSGRKNFEEANKTETQRLLENRYQELTGKTLTPRRAEMAFGKLAKLDEQQSADFNKAAKEIGITEQDINDYEQDRKATERGSGERGNAEPAKTKVQQSKNEPRGRKEKDSGGEGLEGKPKAGDPLREFATKVREGKINKLGGFRAGTGFDAAWDASLEVIATAIEGGAKVADAIEAGLKHVKQTEWYKNLTNKDEFDKQYRDHLTNEYEDLSKNVDAVGENNGQLQVGTKKAIDEVLRDELGLQPLTLEKGLTKEQGLERGKEVVDSGELNPIEIMDKALAGKDNLNSISFSPDEEFAMNYYERQLAAQRIELNKIKVDLEDALEKEPDNEGHKADLATITQKLLNNYDAEDRRLQASQIMGNVGSKYFTARQIATNEKGELINSIERIKTIYGKDIPANVKKELADLQAKYDNLLAKNKKIEDAAKKTDAEENFNKLKPKKSIFRPSIKKTDAEYAKERADIIEQMKADLKKSLSKTYATVPGAPQLMAIAPHVTSLVKSFAEQGISKLDDVITNVHDAIKDIVPGITKDNINDILAGEYSKKVTLSDLNKQVNDLRTQARNLKKIAELEQGILKKSKAKGEASPEVRALQKQVAELKKKGVNEFVDMSIEQLKTEQKTLQTKIDKGEYYKQPVIKASFETNPEWLKNSKEKNRLKDRLKELENEAMDSKKSKLMRAEDLTNRWFRRIIFFGANAVYTKLASAAVLGSFLHRLPEQGIGYGFKKLFPNIARNAPIEGSINLRAEAKFYREFLDPKSFIKNTWDIAKTGETELSRELSTFKHRNHIPIVDLFAADAHIMIKDPVKRAAFEAAMVYQMDWFAKHGIDATNPLILESARQAAYRRAEYEIFQNTEKNGNMVSRFFNELEKKGIEERNSGLAMGKTAGNAKYTAASLYHFFVPINTVPVNIMKRIGLGLRLPYTVIEAISKNKAIREGVQNMTTEESDVLMRQLKKGAIGAAYWTLGFILAGKAAGGLYTSYNPDKKRKGLKSDELKVLGMNIPKNVQHNSQLQALQMGATWGVTYHHFVKAKGNTEADAIAKGVAATTGAFLKQIPAIDVASKTVEATQNEYGGKKFVKDLKRRVGVNKGLDLLGRMGYKD